MFISNSTLINVNQVPFYTRRLLLMRQSGLLQHMEGKYKSQASKRCSVEEVNSGQTRPRAIKLNQLWSIFCLFMFCCLGSVLAFLGEVIIFFVTKQRRFRIQ